jgi:hypothetical protein
MAGPDGASARPDVPAVLLEAEGRLGLRRPFPDAADNRLDAARLSDADHGAARRVCLDMVGANLERLPGLMAADAGKLAALEPRPADAGRERLAWLLILERLAWSGPAVRLAQPTVAAALYTQDEAPFAA